MKAEDRSPHTFIHFPAQYFTICKVRSGSRYRPVFRASLSSWRSAYDEVGLAPVPVVENFPYVFEIRLS